MNINVGFSAVTISRRGRVFMVGRCVFPIHVRFRGVRDEWTEEHELRSGDRVEFPSDFHAIELTCEQIQSIGVDVGYGLVSRFKPASSSRSFTFVWDALTVAEYANGDPLVPYNPNRRRLCISNTKVKWWVIIGDNGEKILMERGQAVEINSGSIVWVGCESDEAVTSTFSCVEEYI